MAQTNHKTKDVMASLPAWLLHLLAARELFRWEPTDTPDDQMSSHAEIIREMST
jgi:hypothetical protein